MSMEVIKTTADAHAHLEAQIMKVKAEVDEMIAEIGGYTPAEAEQANEKFMEWLSGLETGSPLQRPDLACAIVECEQRREYLEKLYETQKLDLIVTHDGELASRKAELLRSDGKLVSPPGFHPKNEVFAEGA